MKKAFELFFSFFKIGAFTLGGGYAMLSMVEKAVVDQKKWIPNDEFWDMIAVVQSLPGVFAVNTALYVGHRVAGTKGAFAAMLGAIIPSITIILLLATVFREYRDQPVVERIFKGIRPCVVALILAPSLRMIKSAKVTWKTAIIPIATVFLIWWLKISPAYVILAAIAGSLIYALIIRRHETARRNTRDNGPSTQRPFDRLRDLVPRLGVPCPESKRRGGQAMIYLQLLWVFVKIGMLGFGGGYAMLSLIQHEVVDHYAWMSTTDFADMVAISQMTPGPISINLATYVGYTTAGFGGSLLASFALCLPSIIMVYFILKLFMSKKNNALMTNTLKGLKPAIAGLIFAAGLSMMNTQNFVDFGRGQYNISVIICVLAFVASYFFKANPILLIVLSGVVGFFAY